LNREREMSEILKVEKFIESIEKDFLSGKIDERGIEKKLNEFVKNLQNQFKEGKISYDEFLKETFEFLLLAWYRLYGGTKNLVLSKS
jgi:NADPH-dependent curcumin reductase CurA